METARKEPPKEREDRCEYWQRVTALPLFVMAIILAYLAYLWELR